jgi:hypothetical protein
MEAVWGFNGVDGEIKPKYDIGQNWQTHEGYNYPLEYLHFIF